MTDEDITVYENSLQLPSTYEKTVSQGVGKSSSVLRSVEWVLLLVSLLNILTCSALTLERLITYAQYRGSPDFTFAVLILINCGFCVFYVINGLCRERQHEIYVFVVAILLVWIYCILEYTRLAACTAPIKLIRMIVCSILACPNIILAVVVARRFGWLQYRIVGASNTLIEMYNTLKIFLSLQNLDLHVSVSMLILCTDNCMNTRVEDKWTLYTGAVYAIIWFLLAFIAVQKEWKPLMWIVAIFGLLMPVYVVFRIVDVYRVLPKQDPHSDNIIRYTVLGVGALSLLVRITLLIELKGVYRNFGYGLQEKAFTSLVNERTNLLGGARRAYLSYS